MATPNLSEIVATTIQSRSGVMADNVTKNNALLAYMSKSGSVKPFSGGNVIVEELSFAENSNAGWYSGYETLPTGAQDVISAAQFDIKQSAVPVTISGLEMLQNSGKEKIIDLLESRIEVAESTLRNLITEGLYSNGTGYGGKQITGLLALAPLAQTGIYGGIDRATWSFWKNQKHKATTDGPAAATTKDNIQAHFNTLWAKCVRGADRPNLIIVDSSYWAFYMASLQAQQRFTSESSASLGFPTVKFMDADVVLDGGIGGFAPSKTAYFLNTKYVKYRPHRERNFVSLSPEKRYSVNQDAEVSILAWAGNMTCSNCSLQGVMQE